MTATRLLGRSDVATAKIYTHALLQGGRGMQPDEAITTQTAVIGLHFDSILSSVPWRLASSNSTKSFSNRGRYTCVSGSPKRALNSNTLGPSWVSIRPG